MKEIYQNLLKWLENYPLAFQGIKIILVLLVAYLSFIITKKIVVRLVRKFTQKTSTDIDDILLSDKTLNNISYVIPLLVIDLFSPIFGSASDLIDVISNSLLIIVLLLAINNLINSVIELLERVEKFKDRPIKGYFQVVKIIIFIWGGVILVGTLTGQSPWTLLGGLSAMTAVLLLIFKDTILSFVASIQISSYDLVKIGDWIDVPQFGADGDVVDISLNVIKVQNWDKTITTIPTYKLVEGSFKNWRGMSESGGRRIARSINIDINSIKFCDDEMIERFGKIQILNSYIQQKREEVEKWNLENKIEGSIPINGRKLTNIGTFRAYLEAYLNKRTDLDKNMTFLVRQLAPSEYGVPIQIYVFASTTDWGKYEAIQSDIFDHIFAAIPYFDLKVYQNPTGNDFKELKS